jgi:hypothetical protein
VQGPPIAQQAGQVTVLDGDPSGLPPKYRKDGGMVKVCGFCASKNNPSPQYTWDEQTFAWDQCLTEELTPLDPGMESPDENDECTVADIKRHKGNFYIWADMLWRPCVKGDAEQMAAYKEADVNRGHD